MPEFVMPFQDGDDTERFKKLSFLARGYVEAMFFTDCQYPGEDECAEMTFADIAPETLAQIVSDCESFETANREDLDEINDTYHVDDESHGRDFWYTRNRHGVGFWDREYSNEPACKRLDGAARAYGEVSPCKGDDGKLYLT